MSEVTNVRISRKTHDKLVAKAAYLTLQMKRKISLTEALDIIMEEKEASA